MTKIYFYINARNTNKNVKINGDYIFLFIRNPEQFQLFLRVLNQFFLSRHLPPCSFQDSTGYLIIDLLQFSCPCCQTIRHGFDKCSFSILSHFIWVANSLQNMRRQNLTSTFCNTTEKKKKKKWKQPKQFKIDLDLVVEVWSIRDVNYFNCFVIKLLCLVPDNLNVNYNTNTLNRTLLRIFWEISE